MLYDTHGVTIVLVLVTLVIVCIECGYRTGRLRAHASSEANRAHINSIQAATLGLLALLLGFTFSVALQRFDSRSIAVVEETNAIGTAFVRADLLPPALRDEARQTIGKYLDARVEEAALPLPDRDARAKIDARAESVQGQMWNIGIQAARLDPNSLARPLFLESVGYVMDTYSRRSAALERHVPELVTLLLLATFLFAGGIVGFAAGMASHRPSIATHIFIVLMVVLVLVVLDLDQPRRGFIQVSHTGLLELQALVRGELQKPGS